jgi:transposase
MDDAALLELPDDPVLLKQVIAQRDAALAQRDAAIAQRESQIEQIKREAAETIEAMTQRHKAEMDAILRKFYGPRSERFDPTQLLLFGLMIDTMPIDRKSVEQEAGEKLATRRVRNRHNHGRQQLPGHLPRVPVPHDLSDEQKKCPCCGKARKCIGVETSEQLECLPIQFHVLRHERYKYACVECDQAGDGANIEMAVKPPQPIEKGLAGPGLLAYVAVSKLADHLPLYRLEDIFARVGVTIARSTMCGWMDSMATLLKPLYDLMGRRVKQGEVIHTDDTRVPVQDETVKGKCKSGRIWCFLGDESNPYDIYHYTPDRTRAGPSLWLDVFKGYLQADAYSGYDGIFAGGAVIEVACWAHARRKFFEAKDTDGRRSAEMLAMVQGLYAVEDEAREAIARLKEPTRQQREQIRHELRQQKSVPILARIKTWLDTEQKLVLPRSPMAQAIGYALNQWTALNRYVEKGFLNIDNNAAERALKRVAIGRKNWLFAGNDHFGQVSATLYSLISSALRHGLNPQAYLMSVLAKIGQTPMSEIGQFLPDVWKREAQAAKDSAAKAAATQSGSAAVQIVKNPREIPPVSPPSTALE